MGCISNKENNGQQTAKQQQKGFFKFVLIGNPDVGKTSMLVRFVEGVFQESLPEGQETCVTRSKTMDFEGRSVTLELWDTAGQEKFRTITSSFYTGTDGVLLVYDICNSESFFALGDWIKEAQRYTSINTPIVLVGNKADENATRKVKLTDAEQFAEKHGMKYIETSAMNGGSIPKAFELLLTAVTKNLSEEDEQVGNESLN